MSRPVLVILFGYSGVLDDTDHAEIFPRVLF
jgi:hypothetical protein